MTHTHQRRGTGRVKAYGVSDSVYRGSTSIPARLGVSCQPESRNGDHDSILGVRSELGAEAIARVESTVKQRRP
jgi:hypothetical protein